MRTQRKRYGQKTLMSSYQMNEMFLVEPVLDIEARWLTRLFLTFLRCRVVSGTGGNDWAGPY